jgi:biotin operon repressor
MMARLTEERRTHRTEAEIAVQLGISEQEVHDHCEDLTARGLLHPADKGLTEDQKRVLYALPTWRADLSESTYPTTAQLAEQLEMSREDVRQHLRALDDKGWMSHRGEPTTVLDALLMMGWHTPANELARRLHMDAGEVDQRLRELADIGYDVRLI